MRVRQFLGFYLLFLFVFSLKSVVAQPDVFTKGYFQLPIYPGQKNTLAGVLGDLRTNHFHAGIDIRTQQREGLPVLAAADGYVSKVKVQTTGYGNVIFIKHPNGMTTVYGHLQSFAEPMRSYLLQKQYERKTFDIELNPSTEQFLVKKGDLIGISGNTGGSAGPHLHFEVRDTKDNFLNPLFFDFPEIADNIPPYFNTLAIRPMSIDGRVNGDFERITTQPMRQQDGSYSLGQPIRAWGTLGVELIAFDAMNDVNFRNGVNCVEIKMDGEEVFAYNMTSFPNRNTRDYNNLIDYATEQKFGSRFLKCYEPDGNEFDLSKTDAYQGKLNIRDTLAHQIQVTLFDSYENSAILRFVVKGQMPAQLQASLTSELPVSPSFLKADVQENILKVTAFGLMQPLMADVFVKRQTQKLQPAYANANSIIYLIDLRKGMPDSIQIGNQTLRTYLKASVLPNRQANYTDKRYDIRFGTASIFDTLYLSVQKRANGLVINDDGLPLRDAIAVGFKPDSLPDNPQFTHAYRVDGGRLRFLGGQWNYNTLNFTTRELGEFRLATDTIPPRIKLERVDKSKIMARISDAMSGVDTFKAFVNDEWVLMNYDYKRALIWSDKLVDSLDFVGEVRIEVTDKAGNLAILKSPIREAYVAPKAVRRPAKKAIVKAKKKKKR